MGNKRNFKKAIDVVGASVCDEMMFVYYNLEGVDREAITRALSRVLKAVGTAKNNANIFFERGPRSFDDRKQYEAEKRKFFKSLFAKIRKDFSEELDKAVKEFNDAVPEEAKQKNKEALA